MHFYVQLNKMLIVIFFELWFSCRILYSDHQIPAAYIFQQRQDDNLYQYTDQDVIITIFRASKTDM